MMLNLNIQQITVKHAQRLFGSFSFKISLNNSPKDNLFFSIAKALAA
jgi:hypothetical protein